MASEKGPFIGRGANSIMAGCAGKKAVVEILSPPDRGHKVSFGKIVHIICYR